eukprot:5467097-Pyramimonas_sp.AAC.1
MSARRKGRKVRKDDEEDESSSVGGRVRCMVHLAHRCSIPMITNLGIASPMYRAANAMVISSYWMQMVRGLKQHVEKHIRVIHHAPRDPRHRSLASQILRL